MKVAIVGGAPSWVNAPFDDKEFEIWVLGNQLDRFKGKRVTRVFEIHDNLSEHSPKYPQWLIDHDLPTVTGEEFPIKTSNTEVFPYDEAKNLMGFDYLTSSPSYMMAYALLNGADHISIYGVNMSIGHHEYFMQRPAMEGWIGFARGLGVTVEIDKSSPLCNYEYVEGRHWNNEGKGGHKPFTFEDFKGLEEEHQKHIDAALRQIEELKTTVNVHSGALQVYQKLSKVAKSVSMGDKINSLKDGVVIDG